MGNSNYRKGSQFERDYIALKEKTGKFIGIRTGGSHSPFDVILLPIAQGELVYACQLKRGKGYVPKPPQEFIDLKIQANVQKLWVCKKDRGEIIETRV